MNKKIILTLALLMAFGSNAVYAANPFNYDLQKDMYRTRDKKLAEIRAAKEAKEAEARGEAVQQPVADNASQKTTGENALQPVVSKKLDSSPKYYPNANMPSAIRKYKNGNYTGCLQELFSFVKKDPSNPIAYYYMAMAYSQIGDKTAAIASYDRVIALSSNDVLSSYATRGKACISGDATLCHPEVSVSNTGEVVDELDAFIAAPYGNGFSDELNEEMKQKELNRIQQNINNNSELEKGQFRRIKELESPDAPADLESKNPTKEEVLAALEVLKNAGVTLSVNQPETEGQKNMKLMAQMMNSPQAQQFNEISMLLGNNNNNNNNNNMMMNMLPMLLAQNGGKNIDPQMIQTMMMQSMLPDINFNTNKDTY